jgi:succinate dehydrogenase/fumarate reductase-like Fe-S protein
MQKRTFKIYRYDPDKDAKPYMQTVQVELDGHERMLLDALIKLKASTLRCRFAAPAAKACAAPTP